MPEAFAPGAPHVTGGVGSSRKPEQQAFWWSLLDELPATQLTKADLVQALAEMHDYSVRCRFASADLGNWPGRVLLIESAHDEGFSHPARAELRAVYPYAQVCTFQAEGTP